MTEDNLDKEMPLLCLYKTLHKKGLLDVYPNIGVHRCGASGSMRACHAAGPGSIPGRDKFPGWGFFGVFPHLLDKCREALGQQGPRKLFGHHNYSLWSPMTWDVDEP